MNRVEDPYDHSFFERQTASSSIAAAAVLPILFEYFVPNSAVDVGCGRGTWLAQAGALGTKRLVGLDGFWIKNEKLLSNEIEFVACDLMQPLPLEERFDLCLSIEVAEHLTKSCAAGFVTELCRLSNVILFSAAIKHQKGEGHINTQWASYWANLFTSQNYLCYDVIRWRIWENEKVDWWFRQNILLFVKKTAQTLSHEKLACDQRPIIDIVHPRNYEFVCKKFGYKAHDDKD